MELNLTRARPLYEAEIQNSKNPYIRHFYVPRRYNFKNPQDDVTDGKWESADPESVLRFTAVGYFLPGI